MRNFEYFLDAKEAKKATPDKALARSLINDMEERLEKLAKLDVDEFSKLIFENAYDALRDFADALLTIDGFKSYSHEASIAYLSKYGFDNFMIELMDKFRYKRNMSKYQGHKISVEEAKEILNLHTKIRGKIMKILKESGLK